jgi:uncharacterized protein YlxP (DUF503 family)
MNQNVFVGVARLELHIPEARSLKQKRSSTRSLVERVRNRHRVLIIEIDHQNLYQRAEFAIGAISTDSVELLSKMGRVERTVNENWSGNILNWDVEIIQL